MIPTFPVAHPPTCLVSTCRRTCTRGITKSTHNGNSGRPYYTCTYHHPENEFSCFDDAIGITPNNPTCECGYYGRRTRNSLGRYFYSCPVGTCGWTQTAEQDSIGGSPWSTGGTYVGIPVPQYEARTYGGSPSPQYGGLTSVPVYSHHGTGTSGHPSYYGYGTSRSSLTPYEGGMAATPLPPQRAYYQNQSTSTPTELAAEPAAYGGGAYGSNVPNRYGYGSDWDTDYYPRRGGCCGCSIM